MYVLAQIGQFFEKIFMKMDADKESILCLWNHQLNGNSKETAMHPYLNI